MTLQRKSFFWSFCQDSKKIKITFMKILITGGKGFIGSHLTSSLVKLGHNVAIVDSAKFQNGPKAPSNVSFHEADVFSKKSIEKIIKKERPEAIYHLAANLNSKALGDDKDILDLQLGIAGIMGMCDAAHNHGVRKIIFSSSAAVYGRSSEKHLSEEMCTNPSDIYGLGKYFAEGVLSMYSQKFNFPCIILRYSTVYGPGQNIFNKGSFVVKCIQQIIENKIPEINGEVVRDFIYIDDVIRANIAALDSSCSGIYNVSSNEGLSLAEVNNKICLMLNKGSRIELDKARIPKDISILNNEKIKRELHCYPRVSIDEGLRLIIKYNQEKNA